MPLAYNVTEAEILEWDAETGLRRYELAMTRLRVNKG